MVALPTTALFTLDSCLCLMVCFAPQIELVLVSGVMIPFIASCISSATTTCAGLFKGTGRLFLHFCSELRIRSHCFVETDKGTDTLFANHQRQPSAHGAGNDSYTTSSLVGVCLHPTSSDDHRPQSHQMKTIQVQTSTA